MDYYNKLMERTDLVGGYDGAQEIDFVYKRLSKFMLSEATKAVMCTIIIRKHYKLPRLIINEICRLYGFDRGAGSGINRVASKLEITNGKTFNLLIRLIEHVYKSDRTISRSNRVLAAIFLGNYMDITENSINNLRDTDKSASDILKKLTDIIYLECPVCGDRVAVNKFLANRMKCIYCEQQGKSKKTQRAEFNKNISDVVYKLKIKEPEQACSEEALKVEQSLKEFISVASHNDLVHLYLVLKEEEKRMEARLNV